MRELSFEELKKLKDGDRLKVVAYDLHGTGDYRDYFVEVMDLGWEGDEFLGIYWFVEEAGSNYTKERVEAEILEEMVGSIYLVEEGDEAESKPA